MYAKFNIEPVHGLACYSASHPGRTLGELADAIRATRLDDGSPNACGMETRDLTDKDGKLEDIWAGLGGDKKCGNMVAQCRVHVKFPKTVFPTDTELVEVRRKTRS